jgi:hypothetical protein
VQDLTEELSQDSKANADLWKNFGCETEAGRMLRNLYRQPNTTPLDYVPRVGRSNDSRFSATSAMLEQKAKALAGKKAVMGSVRVNVPKVGKGRYGSSGGGGAGTYDGDLQIDGGSSSFFARRLGRGKKTEEQIREENNDYVKPRPAQAPGARGRNNQVRLILRKIEI